MQITALSVTDFRGLKDIHIEPGERQLVILEGKNGAGKSSVLNAILTAFAGPSGEEQVRRGTDKAEITVAVQDGLERYTIRRVFSADGATPKLEIKAADGRKMASPKATLDKIKGSRFLDPMAFYAQKGAERQRLLLQAARADLADELDRLVARRKETLAERTVVNRHLKAAEATLASLPEPAIGQIVDVAPLTARKAAIAQAEREQAARQARDRELSAESARIESDIDRANEEITRLKRQIAGLTARHEAVALEQQQVAQAIAAYRPDTDWMLDEEIASATAHNAAVAKAQGVAEERARAAREVERHRSESERLTAAMADLDARRVAALAAVELPVPGLEMDDEGQMRMNGVLLDGLSDSEKLRLSLAVAAALQPDLRDVCLSSGERLDSDGWAALRTFAAERGLRIWVERVGIGFEDAIVIEEGRVRSPGNGANGANGAQGGLL